MGWKTMGEVSCIDHLSICKAECCRKFRFTINNVDLKSLRKGRVVIIDVSQFSDDLIRYYKLHKCKIIKNKMYLRLDKFTVDGDVLEINQKCVALTKDNMCSLHNKEGQPKVCKYPNYKEGVGNSNVYITPNCLYCSKGGVCDKFKHLYKTEE